MKTLFLSIILAYFVIGILLYIFQRSFIYFPVPANDTALTEKIFKNSGQNIKTVVLNEGNSKALIYFGGNAENVENNANNFAKLFSDYTIYLVKYRGFGGSTGTATEEALFSDALHIYDVINEKYETLSIIGRSLGTGVASYVASRKNIDKLVLITPFDSIQNVAQAQFPIYPMSILLKDKYDSYSRAKDIKAKVLVVAAEFDRVIRMSHTERLLEGFSSDVKLEIIKGANHNNISNFDNYYDILKAFM